MSPRDFTKELSYGRGVKLRASHDTTISMAYPPYAWLNLEVIFRPFQLARTSYEGMLGLFLRIRIVSFCRFFMRNDQGSRSTNKEISQNLTAFVTSLYSPTSSFEGVA